MLRRQQAARTTKNRSRPTAFLRLLECFTFFLCNRKKHHMQPERLCVIQSLNFKAGPVAKNNRGFVTASAGL
jgi:hypothetical protein